MKLTKRDLQEKYNYIIRGGYCEFYALTHGYDNFREVGSASGLYGWNWTAYETRASNGEYVCICTGYRDMTGKRIKGTEKYEKKAKENCKLDYDLREKAQKRNAKAFANFVVKNYVKGE